MKIIIYLKVVYCKNPKDEFNMDEFDLTEKNLKIFMLQYCPWIRISALLPNINMNHFCYSKNKFKTLQIQWPPYFHLLGHVTEL